MKLKALPIIIFSLSLLTGCASGSQTPPPKTPAELEQMAQSYQYNGSYEASSEVYRQLIDMNPTSFSSVLYQHQIMLNAQTQNDLSLLIEETLNTLMRLEKAQDEHFDDATPQAIAQEKESLAQFIYDLSISYASINNRNPSELYVWASVFFYEIYWFYFGDISISRNNDDQDHPEETYDVREDTSHYAYRMLRYANYYYLKRFLDYYERIFELYDRGIIPAESITPLSIIQNDILAFKTDYMNAAIDYTLVFSRCDSNHEDAVPGYKFRDIIDIAAKDAYFMSRHRNCYKPYHRLDDIHSQNIPPSECNQKVIYLSEQILNHLDILDNREFIDTIYIIALTYENIYRQSEKTIDLYWKIIERYQNSVADNKDIGSHEPIYDAVSGILYSYKSLKRYDELKTAIQKFKQIPLLFTDEASYEAKVARLRLDKYEEILRLCENPEDLKRWESEEACYKQLDDVY